MSLARDLVELSERLRTSTPAINPFGPDALETMKRRMDVTDLAQRVHDHVLGKPLKLVRLLLRALALQHDSLAERVVDAAVVATLPGTLPIGTFGTRQVVADMLHDNAREVIALGYELSLAEVLVRLQELARMGTSIVLIVDRQQSRAEDLKAGWPSDCPVKIYVGRLDAFDAPYSKMHGKALLVDNEDLLVTSANFTHHGHGGNVELGVRLRGSPARDARVVLDHMVNRGIVELI